MGNPLSKETQPQNVENKQEEEKKQTFQPNDGSLED